METFKKKKKIVYFWVHFELYEFPQLICIIVHSKGNPLQTPYGFAALTSCIINIRYQWFKVFTKIIYPKMH